ncbi:HVA22-like protein [Psidium guajava]|nr:HVA22-like protein [Psidium guajava]
MHATYPSLPRTSVFTKRGVVDDTGYEILEVLMKLNFPDSRTEVILVLRQNLGPPGFQNRCTELLGMT